MRRIWKWLFAGILLVIGCGFFVDYSGWIDVAELDYDMQLRGGVLSITCLDFRPLATDQLPPGVTWPRMHPSWRPRWELKVALWAPLIVLAVPTAFLWYADFRRRRSAPGRCPCGYDLTGNTSGRCPECGTHAGPGT